MGVEGDGAALHVTNGDVTARLLREAEIPGDVLPWRDVLHEGPVPPGLSFSELREVRARYVAQQGWRDYATVLEEFTLRDEALATSEHRPEVVLWFEHDLYDQLQLIQLLDWFSQLGSSSTWLFLIGVGDYLSSFDSDELVTLHASRPSVSREQLHLGCEAWKAFRALNPTGLLALRGRNTGALPFLHDALVRHLEEYPSVRTGLSRTERQIVETLAMTGPLTLRDAYHTAHHQREERAYLGDTVFAAYVQRLASPGNALIALDGSGAPQDPDVWKRRARATDLGHSVLAGERDWIGIAGIDRWLGGVHLEGAEVPWRWDEEARQLVPWPR